MARGKLFCAIGKARRLQRIPVIRESGGCRHTVKRVAGWVTSEADALVLVGGGVIEVATYRCQRCGATHSLVWVRAQSGRTALVRGRWSKPSGT